MKTDENFPEAERFSFAIYNNLQIIVRMEFKIRLSDMLTQCY